LIFSLITAAYVIFGGMRAVMYADAFQAALMLIGMSAILMLTYLLLGGPVEANTTLTQMATVEDLVPAAWKSMGMTGWTSFPELYSVIGLTMVTTIIMGVGIGVLAQPQLVVRFMCAKDEKALNRAIPIGGIFILMTTGVAYTVGALSNVYFYYESPLHQIAYQAAGNNRDAIMPLYINSAMPDIVVVVFMLTLLAAAMSTLSSQFHALGSAAGYDLLAWFRKRKGMSLDEDSNPEKKASLKSNRIGTFAMILISVVLALSMPTGIIAIATALFMGLCASAFLPALTHALFSKRLSLNAAKLSLVLGTISWFLWVVFVHDKEAKILGIGQALFGRATLLGFPWSFIDPLVIAIPISIAGLAIGWSIDYKRGKLKPRPE
ncbi:MAG: sodium:solute symporter family protein, partial [Methanomassiliicoccales archaeon]